MQEQQANMFKKSEFESPVYLSEDDFNHFNGNILVDMDTVVDFLRDEDTSEAIQKCDVPFVPFSPVSPLGPPKTGDFEGILHFTIEIKASETDKKKYLYSASQNRIYVDMGQNFPIHFKWDVTNGRVNQNYGLYVRAVVVFSEQSQAQKRVERCLNHSHEPNNTDDEAIVKNVLRSTRALGTEGVYYCGTASRSDSWLSVLVHFPMPGGHAYQFVCKNSCSSGINRRAIAIIFTLEDACGTVLGRQSVGARVCSCPRRDLLRDEQEGGKGKRKMMPAPPKTPKKVKIEVVDNEDEVVYLPAIPIKGAKTVIAGLEVMQRMTEVRAIEAAKRNDLKAVEEYNNTTTILESSIDSLKKGLQPQNQ